MHLSMRGAIPQQRPPNAPLEPFFEQTWKPDDIVKA